MTKKQQDDIEIIKPHLQASIPAYLDKTKSLKERREHYKEVMDRKMNPLPVKSFNPDKFEPLGDIDDMVAVANRTRDIPPKELPTFGMKPKVFREGQMIGEFESKQDLYLTFAHRCNDLQAQIDKLTEELLKLKPN